MQRYSMGYTPSDVQLPEMQGDPEGDWVRYEDVPRWRPMSEAPRDGRCVLIAALLVGRGVVAIHQAAWNSEDCRWQITGVAFVTEGDCLAWQPLPAPPAPGEVPHG